jgi:RimJ/RimL family protein N-acetyltransferase
MSFDFTKFRFNPLRESDLPMLYEWLQRPHIAEWWCPTPSVDELRDDYISPTAGPNSFIAFHGAIPIGFIQSYVVMGSGDGWWEDETDPGARGIDQFLSESSQLGKGLGSAMVRAFVKCLFADPAVSVVQTDPHPTNERAIRCYLRVGFRVVARVNTPDGPALLMRCERLTETREDNGVA